MIHETAIIGNGVTLTTGITIWSGAVIEDDVTFSYQCVVGSNVFIGRGSRLGENVRIQHGSFIPRNSQIGNYVFIGPNVTMTDDRYPRVGNTEYKAEPPVIDNHVSIGAGAVILPGVKIGRYAMIGAGAVVTKDVPPYYVVVGNPSEVIRVNHKQERKDYESRS